MILPPKLKILSIIELILILIAIILLVIVYYTNIDVFQKQIYLYVIAGITFLLCFNAIYITHKMEQLYQESKK